MPTSAILGKSATAYVLDGMAKERPIRQVIDIGAGCGTYRRLLSPYLPDARWIAVEAWAPYIDQYGLRTLYDEVHVGDATAFDFSAIPEGGAILFGDVLEHISVYQVCEMVASALERFDIAVLSFPIGEWPQEAVGGNPHEAHVASWYIEDLGRRFAPTLAGIVEHKLTDQHSLAVAFLGRTEEVRAALADKADAFKEKLAQDPGLDYCGLDFCPDYSDPRTVSSFHRRIRNLVGAGFPAPPSEDFIRQFRDLARFLEIRSLADAGCGDFSWMEQVSGQFSLYFGLDRDAALIADLDRRFGAKRGHFFAARDVAVGPLPKVDAILCRDLFEENSPDAVSAMLEQIKASGAKYMLASTTPGTAAPLDLSQPPFRLPPPLLQFPDGADSAKLMGAWRIPEPK